METWSKFQPGRTVDTAWAQVCGQRLSMQACRVGILTPVQLQLLPEGFSMATMCSSW